MTTHSSILAWKIPWTGEPSRLQSTGHKESDTTEWLSTYPSPGPGTQPSFSKYNDCYNCFKGLRAAFAAPRGLTSGSSRPLGVAKVQEWAVGASAGSGSGRPCLGRADQLVHHSSFLKSSNTAHTLLPGTGLESAPPSHSPKTLLSEVGDFFFFFYIIAKRRSPITSWQIDGEKNGNSDRLYFLGLQNHCGLWLQPGN